MEVNLLLSIIAGLLALGTGLQLFFARQIVKLSSDLMDHDHRITQIETEHKLRVSLCPTPGLVDGKDRRSNMRRACDIAVEIPQACIMAQREAVNEK